jgi:hypothetical protein
MYFLKITAFAFVFFLASFSAPIENEAHKFYISTTDIELSKSADALQITMRLFTDDLEKLLKQRYDEGIVLNTDNKPDEINQHIAAYISKKLLIEINGSKHIVEFLGKEYEDDMVKCYAEVKNISTIKSMSIQNKILFDIFEEQQNIVHCTIKSKKKSFILIKENDKGMLKL